MEGDVAGASFEVPSAGGCAADRDVTGSGVGNEDALRVLEDEIAGAGADLNIVGVFEACMDISGAGADDDMATEAVGLNVS